MDLIKHLKTENSRENWNQVAVYVGNSPERFAEIIDLFIHGEPQLVQRISQPFGSIVEKHPNLILPYIPALIHYLQTNPTDAVKRNCMRSFQYITIPEDYVGELFDLGLTFLKSQAEPIAVKAFSMTVLRHLCERFPELTNEVIFQLEIILKGDPSAGIRSRGTKEMKKLVEIQARN